MTQRKPLMALSAALLGAALVLQGCSRQTDAAGVDATRSADSAMTELRAANESLLRRVDELESRLAAAEGQPSALTTVDEQPPTTAPAEVAVVSTPARRPAAVPIERAAMEARPVAPAAAVDDELAVTPVLADLRVEVAEPFPADLPPPRAAEPEQETQPAAPVFRRLVVEEGTAIEVEILDPLSTRTSQPGDPFRARLASDLTVGRRVALPVGAELEGHVAEMRKSERIGGRAELVLVLDRVTGNRDPLPIEASWAMRGEDQTGRDAATIGGATVGGAILGRILDKGQGEVIGGILGAAAGTALAKQKVGRPIAIEPGDVLEMVLDAPFEVRVRE